MAVVETEYLGQIMVIRLNRPERMNALGFELRSMMADAWNEFEESKKLEVAIITGTGKAFCAGEDMKEALERGAPGSQSKPVDDPLKDGRISKPVIAAINGFAMGGGFMLAERTDLRVAVPEALFEVSEAKRWLLGGYYHAHWANLPHPVATEMAFGFRFTAERLYQMGFINRLVEKDQLIAEAILMADHLLTLPPASRVNTLYMMRQMRPKVDEDFEALAEALHDHGEKDDLMESRLAFKEKRKPVYKGWIKPEDRYAMPTLDSVKAKQ